MTLLHVECTVTLSFQLPCILAEEADTQDMPHILHNDHSFGITDKQKQEHKYYKDTDLEKLNISTVNMETDCDTGRRGY